MTEEKLTLTYNRRFDDEAIADITHKQLIRFFQDQEIRSGGVFCKNGLVEVQIDEKDRNYMVYEQLPEGPIKTMTVEQYLTNHLDFKDALLSQLKPTSNFKPKPYQELVRDPNLPYRKKQLSRCFSSHEEASNCAIDLGISLKSKGFNFRIISKGKMVFIGLPSGEAEKRLDGEITNPTLEKYLILQQFELDKALVNYFPSEEKSR